MDEIWIVETMSYDRESFLGFQRFENGVLVGSLYFQGAALLDKLENGRFILGAGSTQPT